MGRLRSDRVMPMRMPLPPLTFVLVPTFVLVLHFMTIMMAEAKGIGAKPEHDLDNGTLAVNGLDPSQPTKMTMTETPEKIQMDWYRPPHQLRKLKNRASSNYLSQQQKIVDLYRLTFGSAKGCVEDEDTSKPCVLKDFKFLDPKKSLESTKASNSNTHSGIGIKPATVYRVGKALGIILCLVIGVSACTQLCINCYRMARANHAGPAAADNPQT